jgi:putative Mg2+ transporter-C (MgtC) family protein
LTDPWVIEPLHITLRLILAIVLGGLIGLEREQSNQAAGFRTHILVCLGSALIMLLSIYGFGDFINEPQVRVDPARLAAQVISGIGFLGAGAILRNGLSVSGLTTAASLWVVAAIGLSIGAGFYFAAVLACLFVFISLWLLHSFEKRWLRAKRFHVFKIRGNDRSGQLAAISSVMKDKGCEIRKLDIAYVEDMPNDQAQTVITINVLVPKQRLIISLSEELGKLEGVFGVSVESVG